MLYISGKIVDVREIEPGAEITIFIEKEGRKLIKKCHAQEVELGVEDGRSISPLQRRKIYAMLRDISNHTGYPVEAAKQVMKVEHMLRVEDCRMFSLSNCSMTTAREFINTLLEYALKEGIIMAESGLQRTDDIDYYLIQCIRYRRCCICGQKSDIHHVDTIGMGFNRLQVDDSEKEVAALCRNHHTIAHQRGWKQMMRQYHIYGIKNKRAEGETK